MHDPILRNDERVFLAAARRATLVTIGPDGQPRPVPICFVLDPDQPILYSPIDDKPKTVEQPTRLARVRDLLADPRVAVLADRFDEDWTRLAWIRCRGRGALLEPETTPSEHAAAVAALRAKYAQYATHRLELRPIIRIAIEHAASWGALSAPER